jgi:hypothetical protein
MDFTFVTLEPNHPTSAPGGPVDINIPENKMAMFSKTASTILIKGQQYMETISLHNTVSAS